MWRAGDGSGMDFGRGGRAWWGGKGRLGRGRRERWGWWGRLLGGG